MANENSKNSQELDIGTLVSFKNKNSGEYFQGSVFYFSKQSQGSIFGIQNVSVWRVDGRYEHGSEFYHFNFNDITDLQVNVVARQHPNPQDGQNNNDVNGSSSSTSIEGRMGSLCIDQSSE